MPLLVIYGENHRHDTRRCTIGQPGRTSKGTVSPLDAIPGSHLTLSRVMAKRWATIR